MTPQSTFMFLAPIAQGQDLSLRALLASMNADTGMADPHNSLVPFNQFPRLHFARFVILETEIQQDIGVYGFPDSRWSPSLAFLGDCDGPAETFVSELVERAGEGLRQIFAHCADFKADDDLTLWLTQHGIKPAASYVNWIGRTVVQVREEDILHQALTRRWSEIADQVVKPTPAQIYQQLTDFVDEERRIGRLALTPATPTDLAWELRNRAHLIFVPLALIILTPFLLILSPFIVFQLRSLEKSDPEITPRPAQEHVAGLAAEEDFDITNQFSAFGELKPGQFRRYTVILLLWLLDYASRHIYRRGYLTRVQTIHFARWVFLDDGKRLYFASNYDGSLESYMDDFINKVAWGINLVFGNGIGFPRINWLVHGGAKFEQKYKRYLRRHQLPTAVWYKAYPGLSIADLNRNTRIRQGIDRRTMSESEIREWLSLL